MMQQPPNSSVMISFPLSSVLSRLLAMGIFGLAFAYYIYQSTFADAAMGKAAYLADAAVRYDESLAQPTLDTPIVALFLAIFVFLAYEFLVFGFRKLLFDPVLRLMHVTT